MITASLTTRLSPSDEVLFRDFDGECVLLNLSDESYYGLDPVGTSIWTALGESATVGDAIEKLLEEFEVDRETLERDVLRLANELIAKGMLLQAGSAETADDGAA